MKNENYLKSELYNLIKTDETIFDFIQATSLNGLLYWNLENTDEEWMSTNFWTTLGYNPYDASEKLPTSKSLINQDDLAAKTQELNQHFKDPNFIYEQLVRYTHKNGNTIWMKCRGFTTRNNEGKPLRFFGTYINVTHEIHQTELLNLSQKVAKVGFWEVDLIYNTNTWSSATKTIHEVPEDYEPDVASGINFYKEGKSRNKIAALVKHAIDTGGEWDENLIIVTAKGNEKWVRAKGAVEKLEDKVLRLYGTFQDINEEKLKEIQLAQSEQQFKQTFEHAAIGMAIVGLKGEWIKVNKSLSDIIGYAEAELMQLTFQDITHPDDLNNDLALLHELIERKRDNYHMEKRYFHKNGSIVWITLSVSMVSDQFGQPVHFISQISNITEQKLAQERLVKKHNQLLNLLQATDQVSIIATTTMGLITMFNKGAENLLGYTAEEMVNLQTPNIIHKTEEVAARGEELTAIAGKPVNGFDTFIYFAEQGQFESREWTYVRKNGSELPVQLVVTAMHDSNGTINGYLGIATDITETKKAELELLLLYNSLELANKQLKQKNDELEQFAHVAAHDLQEPLRSVTSALTLIEKKYSTQIDDKGKQYMRFAVDGALRMKNLISSILDYSKADILEKEVVNLEELVNTIAQQFKNEPNESTAQIHVAPLPTIMADSAAMQQLFTNLVSNGIKYQPINNTPIINISVVDKGNTWQFAIADNGIGIEPKYYNKVFTIFKRLHNKSEYSGTGIGLATCKKVVTMHGGVIWIEANTPTGTIFNFTLAK